MSEGQILSYSLICTYTPVTILILSCSCQKKPGGVGTGDDFKPASLPPYRVGWGLEVRMGGGGTRDSPYKRRTYLILRPKLNVPRTLHP